MRMLLTVNVPRHHEGHTRSHERGLKRLSHEVTAAGVGLVGAVPAQQNNIVSEKSLLRLRSNTKTCAARRLETAIAMAPKHPEYYFTIMFSPPSPWRVQYGNDPWRAGVVEAREVTH